MSTILTSYRGIKYSVAKEKLDAYLAALDAVLLGQSYTIGSRTLTRANLAAIQDGIEFWQAIVTKCETGVASLKIQRAIPQDL